jgi:hypothetical protein
LTAGIKEIKKRFGYSSISPARTLLLKEHYPQEKEGIVLRTSSLTK